MSIDHLTARVTTLDKLLPEEILFWDQIQSTELRNKSPFFSRYFIEAVFASGVDVRICIIYTSEKVSAIFPYQFSNNVSRTLRAGEPVGAGMSDYFGLIAPEGFQLSANVLLQLSKLNYFGFSHFSESQLSTQLIASRPRVGLKVLIGDNSELYFNQLKKTQKKYLNDATRLKRKLSEDVGAIQLQFRQSENAANYLNVLIEEKRLQYKRTSVPDALAGNWKKRLLENLLKTQKNNFEGLLSAVFAGGVPVALHFGLLSNRVLHYWFPVYMQSFGKYAPGRLLVLSMLKAQEEIGFNELDLGEGVSDDKLRLANFEHQYFRGAWYNNSPAAFTYRGMQSISWRIKG